MACFVMGIYYMGNYLCNIQSIFWLAANNVWASVLLDDIEYRDRQALEKFKWGIYISYLSEFHLVQKPDSTTANAFTRQPYQPEFNMHGSEKGANSGILDQHTWTELLPT